MADLIVRYKWTYVIGIHTDDTYGRGGIDALRNELSQRNDTMSCILDAGDTTALPLKAEDTHYKDLMSYMNQAWIRNATVAVLYGQRVVAIRFLRYIQDHNSSQDRLTLIASEAWATQVPEVYYPVLRGMLGVVHQIQNVEAFDRHIQSLKPSRDSPNQWLVEYWEDVYHCRLDGSNLTNACNISAQRLNDTSSNVYLGNVIDAVYAFAHAIDKMVSVNCPENTGLCEAVTLQRFSHSILNGTLLREYLYNVSLMNMALVSSKLIQKGDQPVFYDIVHLGRRGGPVKVGSWDILSVPSLDITGNIEWRNGLSVPVSICSTPCGAGEEPVLVQDQSDCCHTCEPCIGDRMVSTGERCEVCGEGTSPNITSGNQVCMNNTVTFLRWSSPWTIIILLGSVLGLSATGFVSVQPCTPYVWCGLHASPRTLLPSSWAQCTRPPHSCLLSCSVPPQL